MSAVAPIRTNLKAEFAFGASRNASVVNHAFAGAPNAVVRGNLTYNDHSVQGFSRSIGINTSVLDNSALTLMILFRPGANTTNDHYMLTGFLAQTGGGFARLTPNGTAMGYQMIQSTSTGTRVDFEIASAPTTPLTTWRVVAVSVSGTGLAATGFMKEYMAGGATKLDNAINLFANQRVIGRMPFCIGSSAQFTLGGDFECAYFSAHHAALTEAEADAHAAALLAIADGDWALF